MNLRPEMARAGCDRRHDANRILRRHIVLLAALLGACGTPPVVPPSLPDALVGVWCNSNDGGKSCWAWDEFTPQGTLQMCGRQEEDSRPFHATATVRFAGRRMCYQVVAASANFWLAPGQQYCTEIVEVHPQHHVYRDLDTGKPYTLLRRPASERDCPQGRE